MRSTWRVPFAVPHGAETDDGRRFRRRLPFAEMDAAEIRRTGDIDRENHRELPLLPEFPDIGRAHPRRDIPIDEADLVAVLVLAEVVEIEALAAER